MAIHKRPHLVVECTDRDVEAPDESTEWHDQMTYHIADDNPSSNNMFIGQIIAKYMEYYVSNKRRWWRIRYFEESSVRTTAGNLSMGKVNSIVVAGPARVGMKDIEAFQDRNDDGYYELNVGIPIIDAFPRYYTEHDAALVAAAEPEEAGEKKDPEAKPGEEVADEELPFDETLHVQDGDVITVYDELGHAQTLKISVV